MLDPSVGVPLEPVFAIVTFAPGTGFTVIPADVAVWPDELGVRDDCVAVAMFVIEPEFAPTRTVIESDAESPFAIVPRVQVTVGTPLTDASVTVVEDPSVVDGATWLINVTVSLDIVWVAATDSVPDVLLVTEAMVVPDGIPKPDTRSPTCPVVKLPVGPVSEFEPLVIDADATLVAAP
jgi:hypothetical protein